MNHLENRKTTFNISVIIQPNFIRFSQNDHNMSGHIILVTDDLNALSQGQNLEKIAHFLHANIKENSLRRITLAIVKHFKGYSNSASLLPITVDVVSKILLGFPPLPGRAKTKSVTGLWDYSTFLKMFKHYDRDTPVLQKVCETVRVAARFSLHFPGGKWVPWEKYKKSNISRTVQRFSSFLHHVWETNWLLNKNCWDGLDIIFGHIQLFLIFKYHYQG